MPRLTKGLMLGLAAVLTSSPPSLASDIRVRPVTVDVPMGATTTNVVVSNGGSLPAAFNSGLCAGPRSMAGMFWRGRKMSSLAHLKLCLSQTRPTLYGSCALRRDRQPAKSPTGCWSMGFPTQPLFSDRAVLT